MDWNQTVIPVGSDDFVRSRDGKISPGTLLGDVINDRDVIALWLGVSG